MGITKVENQNLSNDAIGSGEINTGAVDTSKINATIKNEDKRITAYKKYSENIAKVTPLAEIENITIDGVPKLAE